MAKLLHQQIQHHKYVSVVSRRIVLLFLLLNISSGLCQLYWTETPRRVQVLSNTNATFHWSFGGSQAVAIEWTYLGTQHRRDSDVILLRKEARDIHYGAMGPRSHYIPYNGSATLTLANATFSDLGEYEAKVIDINTAKYITDVAPLNVFAGAAYNISIDTGTYMLTLANNGTSVILPPNLTTLSPHADMKIISHCFNVTTQVAETAPETIIEVRKLVSGNTAENISCVGYYCNRLVSFDQKDAGLSEDGNELRGEIVISLDFNLQNVPVVDVSMGVTFFTDEKTSRRVDIVVIAVIFSTLCVPCFIFGIVVFFRKQNYGEIPQEPSGDSEPKGTSDNTPLENLGSSGTSGTGGPKTFSTADITAALSPAFESFSKRLSNIELHLGISQDEQLERCQSVGSDSSISYKDAVSHQPTPNPGRGGDGGNHTGTGNYSLVLGDADQVSTM